MIYLPQSAKTWNTDSFAATLKREVCALDASLLPLQQGLQNGSYAVSEKLSLTILSTDEDAEDIVVKAGLFYNGIIAGCSCADDPTPVEQTNEYCDVLFRISKQDARTTVNLLP